MNKLVYLKKSMEGKLYILVCTSIIPLNYLVFKTRDCYGNIILSLVIDLHEGMVE